MKITTDFIARLGKEYLDMLAEANNADFVADNAQATKLRNVVAFLSRIAQLNDIDADIEVQCEPKERHGYINAIFTVFDLSGEQVEEFASLIESATAFDVDSLNDGRVCLSITIPNVFVEK